MKAAMLGLTSILSEEMLPLASDDKERSFVWLAASSQTQNTQPHCSSVPECRNSSQEFWIMIQQIQRV